MRIMKRWNGNSLLIRMAKRMDNRFAKMGQEMKHLRKDTKNLFSYVVFLDEEFQKHRSDERLHKS